MNGTKALVVFYSRTGLTKVVAHKIAAGLRGDLEPLVDRQPRTGPLGYLRFALDATLSRTTELGPSRFHPQNYDLVVVGTPIWQRSISPAVRTYLAAHAGSLSRVAFFCTYGAGGSAHALRQLTELAGQEPSLSLAVRDEEIHHAACDAKIRTFVLATQERRFERPSERAPALPISAVATACR